ncbi:hypothetical protein OHD16_10440 [Sphingobacterium sp. ML3W]|uniref:ATP-binding protein n=1 Tax=Sphingobacterium sp. ML3W TaxID=1538644 RepID=UPI00249AD7EC|nr:hypothetical protein [Sphingobacterium sp. ML3W]WFA80378.1 hypothetical protein OGI71_03585 [Sphingobacterium sp. ML3W]
MNTISQIENALKSIDQATFQRLINHLLYLQGNEFISAPGAVVGKEKTSKGTPDSFFCNNGKYLFVECTTKEKIGKAKSFLEKLSKDVEHCFNESITTIKKENIQKVVLACNEKIDVDEHRILSEKVKSYNFETDFEILNIQNLPIHLFEIPKLVTEYLNIEIVKGDIYKLDDFLLKTTKGIQPSLINDFIGREEELNKCLDAFGRVNILLLTGGQGVGKSKLAVRILQEMSQDGYQPIVIQSSGVSLWDDYKHLFLPNKRYIILFDDANKSINNLKYLLSRLDDTISYEVKIVITSRDYVKNEVSNALENYAFEEQNLSELSDDIIGKIVLPELRNFRNRGLIKRKIVDLSKGNARLALMATYSITPNSETNYLNNPVLLYEKYFKKISQELGIFNEPIGLKAIAIVSFFGVIDRKNEELKIVLEASFKIDWNELWTAIMHFHANEILNVYSNEVAKVSDQVLATYVFYKCFLDVKSSIISYTDWIYTFTEKHSHRLRISLIDVNNTFSYSHIRDLVMPHLNAVLKRTESEEDLYTFYKLFWFYKGLDCLMYLKRCIENLNQEEKAQLDNHEPVFNGNQASSQYFELLKQFWYHPTELLRPALELTFILLEKQPERNQEISKCLIEGFKYKYEDLENGYIRQSILFDVLFEENHTEFIKKYLNTIFLEITEILLGWHFTEFGPSKGKAFTMLNFDLYKSDALMSLRKRIFDRFYILFDSNSEHFDKILNKIIRPGAIIDNETYVEELPSYQKIISEKLDVKKYTHCDFVIALAKKLSEKGVAVPGNWNLFIESDVIKISKLLNFEREFRKGKSFKEAQIVKQKEFDEFVKSKDWTTLEDFFLNVDAFFIQEARLRWEIESSVSDIFLSIARKDKLQFVNSLRLFFSGRVSFNINTRVIFAAYNYEILTCDELLELIDDYNFKGKNYWESVILSMVPERQINKSILNRLIKNFEKIDDQTYVQEMIDYLKYDRTFDKHKQGKPNLQKHNIITFLTSIVLHKNQKSIMDFGFDFCSQCSPYFKSFPHLLKEAYLTITKINPRLDYEGKELKAILDNDKYFLNDCIKNGKIGVGFNAEIRLEDINMSILWTYEEYEDIIEDLFLTVLNKGEFTFIIEDDVHSIFKFNETNFGWTKIVKSLVLKLVEKHANNEELVLMLIEVVYNVQEDWFPEFFREFLTINKNIKIVKDINFDRTESWSGSKVPLIQQKIDFFQEILDMIKSLPNILNYAEHIIYFEKLIEYKKEEIKEEQRNDFMEEYY